jgi:NADP-dependent aldehyde dehydrogenase
MRRFQRPVAYQDVPDDVLPPELRDRNVAGVMRRVDGEWTTADVVRA